MRQFLFAAGLAVSSTLSGLGAGQAVAQSKYDQFHSSCIMMSGAKSEYNASVGWIYTIRFMNNCNKPVSVYAYTTEGREEGAMISGGTSYTFACYSTGQYACSGWSPHWETKTY